MNRLTVLKISIFLLVALFYSCTMAEEGERSQPTEDLPSAVFRGFQREEVTNGVVTFIAKADKAEYFQEKGLLVIYNVSFEELSEDGKEVLHSGESEKVVYYEDTGDAEFSGFVRLVSKEEDASFETSSLKYFSATQTIEGNSDTTVIVRVGETLFIRGAGFFADLREKAFAFREGAQGIVRKVPPSITTRGVMQ
jgi:LPS export ABC transporter protein LptC